MLLRYLGGYGNVVHIEASFDRVALQDCDDFLFVHETGYVGVDWLGI